MDETSFLEIAFKNEKPHTELAETFERIKESSELLKIQDDAEIKHLMVALADKRFDLLFRFFNNQYDFNNIEMLEIVHLLNFLQCDEEIDAIILIKHYYPEVRNFHNSDLHNLLLNVSPNLDRLSLGSNLEDTNIPIFNLFKDTIIYNAKHLFNYLVSSDIPIDKTELIDEAIIHHQDDMFNQLIKIDDGTKNHRYLKRAKEYNNEHVLTYLHDRHVSFTPQRLMFD